MDLINSEQILFDEISAMIEQNRRTIYAQASSATVSLFWRIGQRINYDVLENKRADYGKQIVSQLATQLTAKYGSSFVEKIFGGCDSFQNSFPMRKLSFHCHDN